jgi:hypothetical protein
MKEESQEVWSFIMRKVPLNPVKASIGTFYAVQSSNNQGSSYQMQRKEMI